MSWHRGCAVVWLIGTEEPLEPQGSFLLGVGVTLETTDLALFSPVD
jgi:hypothetical protein